MSDRYEQYCLADPTFYDSLAGQGTDVATFEVAEYDLPGGWRREGNEEWLSYRPHGSRLPAQGWKIHVSGCLENTERVLKLTWDYCVRHRLAFKFLRGRHVLHMRNATYANRGSSGKLATIYPVDTEELRRVLEDLDETLGGEPGPYILSDLRWRQGPLYVRYGGFAERYCRSSHGEPIPAVADPDGSLVPDRCDAVFSPPEWVTLPGFLNPALQARNTTTVADLHYRITSILHFSNGGGLYRGEDTRTGASIVLKEARPHAGLSADETDAISLLRRERRMLERLAGITGIPRVYDYLTLGEHEFLVLDYIASTPLAEVSIRRHPLGDHCDEQDGLAEYTTWALKLHGELAGIFNAIHERGVVHGDLHLSKVRVCSDGSPLLLDFEAASGLEENWRPTPRGFATSAGVSGVDADRYALACLGLALFLPMSEVLRLDGNKARQLTEAIRTHFPVPRSFLNNALRTLELGCPQGSRARPIRRRPVILGTYPEGWNQARASLAAGIVTSATPHREDRLFPGDIAQFKPGGGLNIAYGAAGVLYALSVTGCGCYPSFEEWLTLRACHPEPGTQPGLYDGLHGVAYVLDHLGHEQQALDLLDRCRGYDPRELGNDLFGGLSGIGLNLAHFAERIGDDSLLKEALHTAELVADRLGSPEAVPTTSSGIPRVGLMRGSTGPALLFLRLYEQTGEPGLLEHAATALRQDLRHCVRRGDGSMQVKAGGRAVACLDHGGAGIGLVLGDYCAHRLDEEFASADRALRLSSVYPFYVHSGLFSGRAGLITYLSRRYPPGQAAMEPEIRTHIRRLNWHALNYQEHLAFPGEHMLRLSMDLATGSAGILLALGTAMHATPTGLPLLGPTSSALPPVFPEHFLTEHEQT